MLPCTHILFLLPAICCGQYFHSSVITENGTVNINHTAEQGASLHVRYSNLHRKYPDVAVLQRLSTYRQHITLPAVESTTALPTKPIQDGNISQLLPPPRLPATNQSQLFSLSPLTDLKKSVFLNQSHPFFTTQINEMYDDLQLCRKRYINLELRLLDLNNRFMGDLTDCENKTRVEHICDNCKLENKNLKYIIENTTAELLKIKVNHSECISLKQLTDNTTNELLGLRSDLAACVANTEGLEYERDKYIAKYVEATRLSRTQQLPLPATSNTTDDKALLNAQWQYSSCLQELGRTKNQLYLCKGDMTVPNQMAI